MFNAVPYDKPNLLINTSGIMEGPVVRDHSSSHRRGLYRQVLCTIYCRLRKLEINELMTFYRRLLYLHLHLARIKCICGRTKCVCSSKVYFWLICICCNIVHSGTPMAGNMVKHIILFTNFWILFLSSAPQPQHGSTTCDGSHVPKYLLSH